MQLGFRQCNRDEIVEALHAENVIARKYYWPGCRRMEPYRTTQPDVLAESRELLATLTSIGRNTKKNASA